MSLVIHWLHAVVADRPDSHRFPPPPPTHPLAPAVDTATITTQICRGLKITALAPSLSQRGTASPGRGHVAKTPSFRLSTTTWHRRLHSEFAPKTTATYPRTLD